MKHGPIFTQYACIDMPCKYYSLNEGWRPFRHPAQLSTKLQWTEMSAGIKRVLCYVKTLLVNLFLEWRISLCRPHIGRAAEVFSLESCRAHINRTMPFPDSWILNAENLLNFATELESVDPNVNIVNYEDVVHGDGVMQIPGRYRMIFSQCLR